MYPIRVDYRAAYFACHHHEKIGHVRKYTGQPYTIHLAEVAGILASYKMPDVCIAIGWLHDVLEDCPQVTKEMLEIEFGALIAHNVDQLTNKSKASDGNRAARKKIDRNNLASASQLAQTVKIADLMSNTADICVNDPKFAMTYLPEKILLMDVLRTDNPPIKIDAMRQLATLCKQLGIDIKQHTNTPYPVPVW